MKSKFVHWFVIIVFVTLYIIVSLISTIHVIDFFELSNPRWLAISLAIAFEIGAAASMAAIIVLRKMSQALIWSLFLILTTVQMMGNTYYAFSHVENFEIWSQLFGLQNEPVIDQKRILAIISGAILPIVALGFIKSLVDYIRPDDLDEEKSIEEKSVKEEIVEQPKEESKEPIKEEVVEQPKEESKEPVKEEIIKEHIKEEIKEHIKEEIKEHEIEEPVKEEIKENEIEEPVKEEIKEKPKTIKKPLSEEIKKLAKDKQKKKFNLPAVTPVDNLHDVTELNNFEHND